MRPATRPRFNQNWRSCSQVKPIPPRTWSAEAGTSHRRPPARRRHRRGQRQRLRLGVGGPCRVVGERAGLLGGQQHRGAAVRDRLVGADGPVELLALARVVHGHLHGPLGDAGQLGRDRHREAVTAGVHVPGHPLARGLGDEPVGAGRVDRLDGFGLDLRGRRQQRALAIEGHDDVSGGQVAEEGALAVGAIPPKEPVASPEASFGSHSARCSSDPRPRSPAPLRRCRAAGSVRRRSRTARAGRRARPSRAPGRRPPRRSRCPASRARRSPSRARRHMSAARRAPGPSPA